MPRYKVDGKVYNLPEEKVEDFLIEYPEAVLLKEQEGEGKTNGVAVKDAAVTSSPEQASESTELEQVDTSLVSEDPKPKRSGRAQVRARELAGRKKSWGEEFASEISSPKFEDLSTKQIFDIKEKATKDLLSQKSDKENFNITNEQIVIKARDIFENKVLPNAYTDKKTIVEETFGVNPFTDFIGDLIRAGEQGVSTSELVDPAFDLLKNGSDTSTEEIINFIEKNKSVADKNVESDEMRSFNKIYEENGEGVFGFIKGALENPSILPSLLISSIATQASSLRSEEVALASGVGAAAGSFIPVIGTIGGAIGGGAMAMESALTFGELLQEEVGEDLSVNNIRAILEDPEKLSDLRKKSIGRGIAVGSFEGLTGGIAKGIGSKLASKGVSRAARGAAAGVTEAIGGGSGEIAGRLAADQGMDTREILFEAVTGTATAPISVGRQLLDLENRVNNFKVEKKLKSTKFNNFEQAFAAGENTSDVQIDLVKMKNSSKILNNRVEKSIKAGDITKEQGDEIKKNFIDTQSAVNVIEKTPITSSDKAKAVDLLIEKKKRTDNIKAIDDSALSRTESDRVNIINEELSSLVDKGTKEVFGKRTKAAAELASELGFKQEPKVFENTDDYIKAIADEKFDGDIEKAKKEAEGSNGAFLGKSKIFIDKATATKQGSVSVANHEVLHPVLNAVIGDVKQQASIVKDFKSKLNKSQLNWVQGQLDANVEKELHDAEFLTYFSEGILNGQIKYNENVFTKLKDVVVNLLKKAGYSNISFDNAKGVYNFLKEYNNSIIKNDKVSSEVVEAIRKREVEKGVKAADVESISEVDLSKNKELGNEIKALVPEGTTKRRYDSRIIGDVYAKLVQGNTLDGLINGQLNKFGVVGDNVYGKPKDIFLEDVKAQLYEKSLTRFDPESNDDLGGFVVNELIRYRIGDVVNKYKKEAGISGKSLDVAAGEVGSVQEIADESTSIEDQIDLADTETRSKTKLIKATKVLSKEQYDKAAEIVKEKVKDIDPKNLSYKKVSGFVTDIVSKVIGVPAGKITDPKKNLSKGETTAGAMFIENNIDYIRKTLPKGAVTEAATEKLIGTATGVPNSVLKLLYDKNPRIKKGAGLSPWTLKKGLTNQDILDAIGRPKRADDKRIQIEPRSPEGQIIKGILSIVDKNIANELVRTVDSDLTLEQKQDVAAGKSATMFSKVLTANSAELLSTYNIEDRYNGFDNTNDIDNYIKDIKRLSKVFNTDEFKLFNSTVFQFTNKVVKDKDKLNYLRKELAKLRAEGILEKRVTVGRTPFSRFLGGSVDKINKSIKSPNRIEKYNTKHRKVFVDMWGKINDVLSDPKSENRDLALPIMYFLENAINERSNPMSMGATAIASAIKKGKVIWDHSYPQAQVYRLLMDSILDPNKDFKQSFNRVLNNYNVIALTKADQKLVDDAGFAKNLGDNELYWERLVKAGVDLNDYLYFGPDGKSNTTLADHLDVPTKTGTSFSKISNLDKAFNDILENKSGIPSRKRYGIVEAITKGSSKGRFNFFIPPSAEDFVGLLYPTLGKGEVGDAQMSWYKKNLIDPYAESMNKLSRARIYLMNNYNLLKKQLDVVPKDLGKKVKGTDYTREQAVRVYIWNKQKMNIPGISDADVSKLTSYVADDTNLQTFGDQLINMQMGDGYIKPKESWPAGTITTDILEGLNTTKRAKYLKAWQENVDAIFSEENLNKLQAIYGLNYRKALENMLKRMKTGRNRSFPGDSLTGRVTDWLTGSVGTIMFLNTRSAVLQTISAINFVNFTDNNVLAAGKAFANQKQYWADFMKLMNSDFLKERRGGLRINVNEADIADMAKKGGAKGAISKLLELGFAPTQIADSFAIASGGSAFYRNRINTYLKEKDANGNNLYTEKQAEKKAFEDFRETAEESQQSSRADRISMQQASPLGRVVLAFANTPAQYARIIKKAASDLKNGRGDAKTNISKIIYYGFAQNLIFNALQQALFAVGFGDEEPEDKEKEKKYINIANGMLDSILRGSGIGGTVVSVGKNAVVKLVKELDKDRPKLQNIASEVLKISPPISAKYSRLVQAGKSYDWNKDEMKEKGLSLDNPAFLAGGNVLSALTNIPLDRAIKKANNVVQATSQDLETWERIALLGGWQSWELGIKEEKKKKKKKKRGTLKSGKIKTRKLDI